MKCLQIHNDYLIPGGETESAKLIANAMEDDGIKVIKYYKSNTKLDKSNVFDKVKYAINSIYNNNTKKEIEKIIENEKIDFALVHNVSPIISNSVYSTLNKNNIPIIKYIQNYNILCLNGSKNNEINKCFNCINKCNFIGVINKCYKDNYIYTCIKYINKKIFDIFYKEKIYKYISISEFVKKEHLYTLNESKVEVIYHFVNENKYNNNYKKYYLFMGRLSEEKGINTLLESFKKLKELELVIIGDGPMREYVETFIKENELDNICYLGFKNGLEKEELIKSAYALIVPSEWDEPFGRIVIESNSYGTPVIASARGGLSELIIEGETGYTFNSNDLGSLIEKINIIENLDEYKYKEIRRKCFLNCKENFSQKAYITNFKECIRNLQN